MVPDGVLDPCDQDVARPLKVFFEHAQDVGVGDFVVFSLFATSLFESLVELFEFVASILKSEESLAKRLDLPRRSAVCVECRSFVQSDEHRCHPALATTSRL